MVSIDDFFSGNLAGLSGSARDPVMKRAMICLVLAGIEGAAAAALAFISALVYHAVFLMIPVQDFAALFYLGFALMAGTVYGAFSAIACARFLDGEQRLQSTLPDSFYGWTAAIAITLLLAFLLGQIADLSRVSLTAAYVLGVPATLGLRTLIQRILADRIQRGELHFEKIALVGKRLDVLDFLLKGDLWRNGHKLTGVLYVEDASDAQGCLLDQAIADFARDSLRQGSDHIVYVSDLADINQIERILTESKRFALNVVYAPASMNQTLRFLDVVAIGPNNALRLMRKPMSDAAVFLKRASDLAGAGFGLILLSPLLLLVGLAITIDSPGQVIYRQARRGFNGDAFMIWKFRTMSVTESGLHMRQAQPGDVRITRVGRWLRASSVDELPQLVNVLLGQMSLVGPRPHAISHDAELSKQMANYAHRQRIKPGITGWAQVNGFRGETVTREQVEGRVLHDIYYIDNWSIFLDVWILMLTFVSPTARRNAR